MKNIKYRERQNISPSSTEKFKDFSQVLSSKASLGLSTLGKVALATTGAGIVAASAYLLLKEDKTAQTQVPTEYEKTKKELAEQFTIHTASDTVLVTEAGTLIHIPANAFDEPADTVTIVFQDYYHPLEAIVNDIDMKYDSAGTAYDFESAGMFAIRGYAGSAPVHIKKGEAITVELISPRQGTEFNQYFYNDSSGNWQYLGTRLPQAVSASELKEIKKALGEMQEEIEQMKSAAPMLPDMADESKLHIRLDVNEEKFPELAGYKKSVFEINADQQNFTAEDTELNWFAEIGSTLEPLIYNITLTRYERTIEIPHAKVVIDANNYASAKAKHELLYATYEEELARKQEAVSKKRREMQELKQKNENTARFKNRLAQMNMVFAGVEESYAVRLFTVNGFGLYNSDCPQKLPQSAPLALTLLNSDLDTLMVKTLHLVELDRNMMYTFNELNEKVQFNNNADNVLIGISTTGEYFAARKDDLLALKPIEGKATLEMKSLGKIEDVNQLKDVLGI